MSHSSTSIIVFGASGRMGSRICAIASSDPSTRLIAAVVREGSAREGQIARDVADGSIRFISPQKAREIEHFRDGVVIDFSSDEGAVDANAIALHHGAALVVGTTALSPKSVEALRRVSLKIPVLISPNTSMGVAVLSAAVRLVAKLLGPEYECSIVEAHHSKKKDAPSGTALRLAKAAREGGSTLRDDQVLAVRGGDVIGEHTVRFAGSGEYVELTHRATSRDLFAQGAIRAARWIAGKPPGMYTMEDVLGVATTSPQNRA
jgi:4-hydroxy-tetrahydrodipicolinate reductase